MPKVFFTSDLHFGHSSILHFHPERLDKIGVSRELLDADPHEATRIHDEWLIDLWNSTIERRDMVYYLGDFCMRNSEYAEKILNKLHGRKYLIKGNHDKPLNRLANYFEGVWDIKEGKFTNNQFKFINPDETFTTEMCHYPLVSWNRKTHGSVHLHGHTHGNIDGFNDESMEMRVDVGLDGKLANYRILSLEDIYGYFCERRANAGCKTFEEYQEMLYARQGFRN